MLKHFKVDQTRTKLVVPIQFYQMGLAKAVAQAMRNDPKMFEDGTDTLPSWSKFAKNPVRAKGWYTRVLQAMFLGQGNLPGLQVDIQTEADKFDNGLQVSMMFLPGSLRNKDFSKVVAFTQQTLPGFIVLGISGGCDYNGKKITNANAEKITQEVIYTAKKTNTPVLILSAGMAQRSYSIGEITNLYLCYDAGEAGATTQKISRVLTMANANKVGRIYSLSFDPNRDDKFDTMMIAAAQNIAKRKGIEIDDALRNLVIPTIDLFACTDNGRVAIDCDTYLEQLMERNSLSRMVGQQADMSSLSIDELMLLAAGNSSYGRVRNLEIAPHGKTGGQQRPKQTRKQIDKEGLKLLDKARKTLVTIIEHLPQLVIAVGVDSIADCLEYAASNKDYNEYITTEFGLPPESIKALFDRGVINYDLASLQKSTKIKMLKTA